MYIEHAGSLTSVYCTHLGRRGAPLVEVAKDILYVLFDLELGRHPGVHPGGVLGAVQEGGGVDVGLPHRLEQRRHELQEVGPLAAAHPVAVVAAVQPVLNMRDTLFVPTL